MGDNMDQIPRGAERYSQLLVLGGMITVWGSLMLVIVTAVASGH
jgi:hypothetical protein